MKTCYIYTRTATQSRIDSQIKECLEFARTNNFKVKKLFKDIRASANNLKRNNLLELLESCKSHPVDAVIILRLDRLTRNIEDFSLLKSQFRKLNVQLISVHEGELSTPVGSFTASLLIGIEQYYFESQRKS